MNFYNDICKDTCAWTAELIREGLIPNGIVSDISIKDIKAHELTEFTQCHFFSGICGWPLAFQIAGIPDDENADTGSCPCQPFSGTGKQMGFADPRHLWPAFRRIENRRRPAKIYGEQVASALGREWLSRVFSDLEIMGYAGTGADLCSAGVGSPNIRQRLYWAGERVGNTASTRLEGHEDRAHEGRSESWGGCEHGRLALANRVPRAQGSEVARGGIERGDTRQESGPGGDGGALGLGYADHARREGRLIRWDGGYERAAGSPSMGMWSDCELIWCRDEKWRRIEPGSFPLADGIPSRVGPLLTELRKLGRSSIALARANRNLRLKGYGNAINPWVAASFIAASRGAAAAGRVSAVESQPLPLDE